MSGAAWRFTGWLQRHRTLARLIPRRIASDLVWGEAMKDPAFVEGMRRGEADIAAGRSYRIDRDTHKIMPNPDWPSDGPQPDYPRGVWSDWR